MGAFIIEADRSASIIEAQVAAAPKPGTSVRGSSSGRPVMALLDLLGRRWTLRVLWELRTPAASFRDLQSRCDGMSSSVLSVRLADLRDAGAVAARADGGYELTAEGRKLLEALEPLDAWAKRWGRRA
jgi:DNA-binding HxlR family transcriptional regulator